MKAACVVLRLPNRAMSQSKLVIRKFDVSTMKKHRICVFLGRRGTGKSVLLNDVLGQLSPRYDFGVAMSPTEESTREFRKHMPEQSVFDNFEPSKLETMLRMQRNLSKKHKMRNMFIIMDDCMYDKKVLSGVAVRDLFMNGRHLNISFFNCMQYMMDMQPCLRAQIDYLFTLRENIIENRTRLWKYFFGMFGSYAEFSRVMDQCTENYSALVLDMTAKTNKIEDCVFWYRADAMDVDYFMGSKTYCRLSDVSRKTAEELEEEERQKLMVEDSERKTKAGKIMVVVKENDAPTT